MSGHTETHATVRNSVKSKLRTPAFHVSIHPCADTTGYWAECKMKNGCCFTDGETIQETQKNMFESVDLYLEDYPGISNYHLTFEVCDD